MFKQLYGQYGKVDVPSIGALIGEMTSWDLTRREEPSKERGIYVLRAHFSNLSEWMFIDPAIRHRIVIEIGRGNQYRLEVADDARTVLDGQSLLIEGVNLCHL